MTLSLTQKKTTHILPPSLIERRRGFRAHWVAKFPLIDDEPIERPHPLPLNIRPYSLSYATSLVRVLKPFFRCFPFEFLRGPLFFSPKKGDRSFTFFFFLIFFFPSIHHFFFRHSHFNSKTKPSNTFTPFWFLSQILTRTSINRFCREVKECPSIERRQSQQFSSGRRWIRKEKGEWWPRENQWISK